MKIVTLKLFLFTILFFTTSLIYIQKTYANELTSVTQNVQSNANNKDTKQETSNTGVYEIINPMDTLIYKITKNGIQSGANQADRLNNNKD